MHYYMFSLNKTILSLSKRNIKSSILTIYGLLKSMFICLSILEIIERVMIFISNAVNNKTTLKAYANPKARST